MRRADNPRSVRLLFARAWRALAISWPARAHHDKQARPGVEAFEERVVPTGPTSPPPHQAPLIAFDDTIDTDAGNPVAIAVLANDSTPNAFLLSSVTVVNAPGRGSVSLDPATGVLTYTPADGFAGTDAFRYTFQDVEAGVSNPAIVTVVVNRPHAADDTIDTDAGNPVTIPVLANDTDPDGNEMLDKASVAVVASASHGTTSVNTTTGDVTYTPAEGFAGTDTFRYTVKDVHNAVSNEATVTVVVNRPQANDDSADTDAGNPVTIAVLANDTDPDGNEMLDSTSVAVVASPGHGTATVSPAGTVTYTPAEGFAGTDTFRYTVKDVHNAVSNEATVTVVVNRPQANDDSATTTPDPAVTIAVLANDTDPDGNGMLDSTSVALVASPAHGSASVSASGTVTYTPAAGFAGTDTFQYTVKDVHNAVSNVATVSVAVNSGVVGATDDVAHAASYVTGLYAQLFGRNADGGGLAYWEGVVNGSDQGRVAAAVGLVNSFEAQKKLLDSYYASALHRSLDSAALTDPNSWLSLLLQGRATAESVGVAFLASDEYFNDAKASVR